MAHYDIQLSQTHFLPLNMTVQGYPYGCLWFSFIPFALLHLLHNIPCDKCTRIIPSPFSLWTFGSSSGLAIVGKCCQGQFLFKPPVLCTFKPLWNVPNCGIACVIKYIRFQDIKANYLQKCFTRTHSIGDLVVPWATQSCMMLGLLSPIAEVKKVLAEHLFLCLLNTHVNVCSCFWLLFPQD